MTERRAFDLDSVTEFSRAGVRAEGTSSLPDSGRTDGDVMPSGTMPATHATATGDIRVTGLPLAQDMWSPTLRLAVWTRHSAVAGRKLGARLRTRRWAEAGRRVARSGS